MDYRYVSLPLSSKVDGLYYQTIYQQTTPFYDPHKRPKTELTVIDPRHPLFNRRFTILSMSDIHLSQGHVYVIYRDGVTLRIPFSATDLFTESFSLPSSKLTASSIKELISLAKEFPLLCQSNPKEFGKP
jgi:hypothetical protein